MKFSTTLITGATGGIGWELARKFARDSQRMVLVGRTRKALEDTAGKLADEFGVEVRIVEADLARPGAAEAIAAELARDGIEVDALVNCAGFGYDAPFAASDLERQRALVQVNDMALMELCGAFAPGMQARRHGAILNVASIAGFMPGPKMSTYYASKAFVQSFTQALHIELLPSGVHVCALCPGPVRTPFWKRADAGRTALAYMTLPASVVASAAYLDLRCNKTLCIPGLLSKVIVLATRILPRGLIARIAELLQTPVGAQAHR